MLPVAARCPRHRHLSREVTINDDPKGARDLRMRREYRTGVHSQKDAVRSAGHPDNLLEQRSSGHLIDTTAMTVMLYNREWKA